MDELFQRLKLSVTHLQCLHDVFSDPGSYPAGLEREYESFQRNSDTLKQIVENLKIPEEIYGQRSRQMILADLYEYLLLGRGYYALKHREDKQAFAKAVLHFVNLLMSFEAVTVEKPLRDKFLDKLASAVPDIRGEKLFAELREYQGAVGVARGDSPGHLDKYFDKLLPKTAGGLWHELLVFLFLLRNNLGYILPILLSQRLLARDDNLIPPDFILITFDKRLYGIEVGMKKEIQSGSFSLRTALPTATIDTINSRSSDRCPKCRKWILFCPHVIDTFADFESPIGNSEVRCLTDCPRFIAADIASGCCPYAKYSRSRAATKQFTHHEFSNGLHYHYQCVLNGVSPDQKKLIVEANDTIGVKTHFPHYAGLEALFTDKPAAADAEPELDDNST